MAIITKIPIKLFCEDEYAPAVSETNPSPLKPTILNPAESGYKLRIRGFLK